MPLFYLFSNDGKFEPITAEAAHGYGGDRSIVLVDQKANGSYLLSCDQYYSPNAVCQLEITQPLKRALITFAAVICIDSQLEDMGNDNVMRLK